MNQINELQDIINHSENIVFFTGAGVSTDSGIPDFRSTDGLYFTKYDDPPETILSHSYFMQHTEKFFQFYKDKMIYRQARPSITHHFIATCEQKGKSLGVITQNIDSLHTLAGSKNVVELHGSTHRNTCMKCGRKYSLDDMQSFSLVPVCSCTGIIKPDVILYEETLNEQDLMQAIGMIHQADTMIVLGTSLNVYPAAGLIRYFKGKHLVIINKSTTPYDHYADLCINAPLKEILSKIQIK